MSRSYILSLMILLTGVVGSWASDETTLYQAETVYTMAGAPLTPGQVLVSNGKIKAVGENIDLAGITAKVVNLGAGSVLMPGLVDPYTQAGLGTAGTDEITSEITPDFQAVHSIDWDKAVLRRQRLTGTTTMCVCPGTQNVFSGVAAIIKTLPGEQAVLNPDGPLLASLCSDPAARNRARSRPDSIYVRQPTNRMGVVWILRKTFDKAQRAAEKQTSPVVLEALQGNRPLMIVSRMSHDLTTVATLADEFEFSPILVGGQEAYKVKDMIAERNYPLILQRNPTGVTRGAERSELCWNQAEILANAGIRFSFSGNDLLEQARFAHRFGLSKEKALQAITQTPAQLLGIAKRVGSIEPGKDADLIALNGEPLELTTSIRWVMVDGQTEEMNKE